MCEFIVCFYVPFLCWLDLAHSILGAISERSGRFELDKKIRDYSHTGMLCKLSNITRQWFII